MKFWFSVVYFHIFSLMKTNANQSRVTSRNNNNNKNDELNELVSYKESFPTNKDCTKACFPGTGDLLIGRKRQLFASSTCGLNDPERYCVLGQVSAASKKKKCFVCDSRHEYSLDSNQNSHRIQNIVSIVSDAQKWWQSKSGEQSVYIQLNLESEFLFTHFIMKFRTFRPAAMLVERSSDFGNTWTSYAYFAYNCRESFPHVSTRVPKKLGEVYCESRYSRSTPTSNGEVIFKAIPPNLQDNHSNPYSNEIIDLLKITNLRINFTKLHTLGDLDIDSNEDLKEKYYYAVSSMIVGGRCLCYGHASECIKSNDIDYLYDSNESQHYVVHGKCKCEHNTDGNNCNVCLPLYNDHPWAPANSTHSNTCVKCECNNHAHTCTFSMDKFVATGYQHGGICDCKHNTKGDHCDVCEDKYYRDTTVDLTHDLACKPCNCDLRGALDDTCTYDNGQCTCKANVQGRQCDRCKEGYFNLTLENQVGCERCECNRFGTLDDQECNPKNGNCQCKKNVVGQRCDRCKKNFYGFNSTSEGCKACDCDAEGSLSSECDVTSGQCLCKSHLTGRRCDQLKDGHYCMAFDNHVSEAEDAEKSSNVINHLRYAPFDMRKKTWTGDGYVLVTNNSVLKFTIVGVQIPEQYYFVLRYEFQGKSSDLNEITVSIQEIGDSEIQADERYCKDTYSDRQILSQAISLDPRKRYYAFKNDDALVCLESTVSYEVTIEFKLDSKAKLLVDSLLVLPDFEIIDGLFDDFLGSNQNLKKFHYCLEKSYEPRAIQERHMDECKHLICTISNEFYGVQQCACDTIGSMNASCEPIGGQCSCHSNINTRQCEACAIGSWAFSTSGCQLCNCNAEGSKTPECNLLTGQCVCYDNIKGKHCNECKQGYWNFPACQPCDCNGLAGSCDAKTGQCLNCTGFSTGDSCEKCADGYFGSPVDRISCKKCSCPGGLFDKTFANGCSRNLTTGSFKCHCKKGYEGDRCDKCVSGFYGNPLEEDGECKPCDCNGNIDSIDSQSCDSRTGACLKCLAHTTGPKCDMCEQGFYGDPAHRHYCEPCNCNPLGSVNASCDMHTGKCFCLPHVIGHKCSECEIDYWNFYSGKGCEACDCDLSGVEENCTSCDAYDGQCSCVDDRAGRRCDQCPENYYDKPSNTCKKCACFSAGSQSNTCDKTNGKCICVNGVAGDHCDRCDRGFAGKVPYCTKCGQCFDQWDEELRLIQQQIKNLESTPMQSHNDLSNFSFKLNEIEIKLNEIKRFLNPQDLFLNQIVDQLSALKDRRDNILQNADLLNAHTNLNDLQFRFDTLMSNLSNVNKFNLVLNQSILSIQETFPQEAIESINTSEDALAQLDFIILQLQDKIDNTLKTNISTITLIFLTNTDRINAFYAKYDSFLDKTKLDLNSMLKSLSKLNEGFCGSTSLECTNPCGAPNCNKCGLSTNDSCSFGIESTHKKLNDLKHNFNEMYMIEEKNLKNYLLYLNELKTKIKMSHVDMNRTFEYAQQSIGKFVSKIDSLKDLIRKIEEFFETYESHVYKIEGLCSPFKPFTLDTELYLSMIDKINKLAQERYNDAKEIIRETNGQVKMMHDIKEIVKKFQNDRVNMGEIFSEKNKKLQEYQEKLQMMKSNVTSTKKKNDEIALGISNAEVFLNEINKTIDAYDGDVLIYNQLIRNGINRTQVLSLEKSIERNQNLSKHSVYKADILRERTNSVNSKVSSLIDENKQHSFQKLMKLKEEILRRKEALENKKTSLLDLTINQDSNHLKNKLNSLNLNLMRLNSHTKQLKKEIYDKMTFFTTCN